MRPVTLRIAVGPANSDDVKVVQTLTQAFARRNSQIRLRPMQTDGATASAAGAGRRQGRSRHHPRRSRRAEERAGRRDAAQERRGAVGAAGGQGQRQEGRRRRSPRSRSSPDTASAWSAAPQANVNLLKVILQQYGVDPAKVEIVQFPANEAAEAIRNQKADAYLAAGPVNSKITTDAIAASTRDGGAPTFLAIDSAEAIAQNHPVYEASEIPAGALRRLARPAGGRSQDDQLRAPHRGAERPVGIDRRRLHPATVRDPPDAEGGFPAGGARSRRPTPTRTP